MQRSLREKEAAMKILLLELSGKGSEEKRKGLAMIAENERAEEERLQNGMKGHERERTAEINALRDDVTVLEEVRKCRQSRCQTECNENQHQQTSDKDTPDAVIRQISSLTSEIITLNCHHESQKQNVLQDFSNQTFSMNQSSDPLNLSIW